MQYKVIFSPIALEDVRKLQSKAPEAIKKLGKLRLQCIQPYKYNPVDSSLSFSQTRLLKYNWSPLTGVVCSLLAIIDATVLQTGPCV